MVVTFSNNLRRAIRDFIVSKRQAWAQKGATSFGKIVLHRQRIFILPTRFGWMFAVMLMAMLIGSINYASSLGFMLTFLLAAMGLVSVLHTHLNLLNLEISFADAEPVFAGSTAWFPCFLADSLGRPRNGIEVAHGTHRKSYDVPANTRTPIKIGITTLRRGALKLDLLHLETRYPLGLFRSWTYIASTAECIVYPAPLALRPLPLGVAGNTGERSRILPGGEDFLGLRNYHFGDSPRHIHWPTVARGQNMQTKQFGQMDSKEVWLDWNMLPDLPIETRLGVLCQWVIDAHDKDLHYGLRLPSGELPLGTGDLHRRRCLQALALAP